MVCKRCVLVVSEIFREAGFPDTSVQLGKASVNEFFDSELGTGIIHRLNEAGFEVLFDERRKLVEQIKELTTDFVYHTQKTQKVTLSEYLCAKLKQDDYTYLSTLFSSVEGTTIEKYRINLKIEWVKELMLYTGKTLSKIASEVGYRNVSHLSGQFKKVTGFTPSYFKKLEKQKTKTG